MTNLHSLQYVQNLLINKNKELKNEKTEITDNKGNKYDEAIKAIT